MLLGIGTRVIVYIDMYDLRMSASNSRTVCIMIKRDLDETDRKVMFQEGIH